MRKNFKTLVSLALFATLLTGCGDEAVQNQADKSKTSEVVQQEESSSVEEKEEEKPEKSEKTNSGKVDLKTDDFELNYIKHEISKDYEGKPCLLYYYSFKNLKDEATQPMVASTIKCFQGGVECDIATPKGNLKEIGNDLKEIKTGAKINCVAAFLIKKGEEATIEAEPLFSFDETEKQSQIIQTK